MVFSVRYGVEFLEDTHSQLVDEGLFLLFPDIFFYNTGLIKNDCLRLPRVPLDAEVNCESYLWSVALSILYRKLSFSADVKMLCRIYFYFKFIIFIGMKHFQHWT